MVKHTRKHLNRKRRTRRSHRNKSMKMKKGGMPPPISDAARYSYPPYFPNKGAEGKDFWPVKFEGPKISDMDVQKYKDFPLGEDVIVGFQEQAGTNVGVQSGGYVYDPRLLKKLQSKHKSLRNYKAIKGFKPMPLMVKKVGKHY